MHAEQVLFSPVSSGGQPLDELVDRLRAMRGWSGVSYRELHRQVVRARRERGVAELPAYDTVYRCLQPGRSRLDVELVTDIVSVLANRASADEWRHAYRAVAVGVDRSAVVGVSDRLPADVAHFTGREAELGSLTRLAPATGATGVITGMAGVGKTALAVHAAHLLARSGRVERALTVDLRAFGVTRSPADPAAVLDGFLRQLGVPGCRIAGLDLPRRSALFRELLAEHHSVLLLDNAESEAQVASLLPSGPGCVVLITSRSRLPGIGGLHVALDVFDRRRSVDLLRRAAGPDRIDADPESARRIAALVGDLPLALTVVAERIATMPRWSLPDHLERLREQRNRLKLDAGVRVAVESSYDALPSDHRLMLRLISLGARSDYHLRGAAALSGRPLSQTERILTDLAVVSMVRYRTPSRFTVHELVRVFCADRARDECSPSERRAAIARLQEHSRASL